MPRRVLEGNVVSAKTDKTVTVLVERRFMHPVYKKYVRKSDKYAAHDEQNMFKEGDRVLIEECRPMSKSKRWKVVEGLGAAAGRKAGEGVPAGVKAAAEKVAAAPKKAAKPKAEKAPKAEGEKKEAKKPAAKKPAKKTEE
ncbi:MAG: 30S ribosomal protein S17 [Micavibrio aeruginosavorus]|nr:30S ribosomal protein S17 [Micavibrio aeruginosavorus]